MRTNIVIDVTESEVDAAKQDAFSLVLDGTNGNVMELFTSKNLADVETGIKEFPNFSQKGWLLSSILLYTIVYDKNLYSQSGLDWRTYTEEARARLGINQRDISEMLSAARFFIQYHKLLIEKKWNPTMGLRKLSRCELALKLCDDLNLTVAHLVNDTWEEFKQWYSGYKSSDKKKERKEVKVTKGKFLIDGKEAVKVSSELGIKDRKFLGRCIKHIFNAISSGKEVEIVTDEEELENLRLFRIEHKNNT